jgi:hypothetical protein
MADSDTRERGCNGIIQTTKTRKSSNNCEQRKEESKKGMCVFQE